MLKQSVIKMSCHQNSYNLLALETQLAQMLLNANQYSMKFKVCKTKVL